MVKTWVPRYFACARGVGFVAALVKNRSYGRLFTGH